MTTLLRKLNFKNKKVLVFGLGLLGGGVATTNWLIKHGDRVTITDLKDENYLVSSLKRIKGEPKLKLNGHDKRDIEDNDTIVFNPDVPIKSPFVKYARELGKQIENEATIFYKLCQRPIVAVTGTRGKTTTVNWTNYLLNSKFHSIISGNSLAKPYLKNLDKVKNYDLVVTELPSYQLELFDQDLPPPHIAVITNVYQDHLNRHGSMTNYARANGNVFRNHSADDYLVLNHDNPWTKSFLKPKPRSSVYFFSLKSLPKSMAGVFSKSDKVFFQKAGRAEPVLDIAGFIAKCGDHNLENILAASIAANLAGVPWSLIQEKIITLPSIPFR